MYNIGQIFQGKYPPDAAVWCNRNGAYIEAVEGGYQIVGIPESTLDEVKAEKITSLKADRDRLEVEDIEVDGHLYDYDEKARERINNAIIALQASGTSILWTLANNDSLLVTAQDLDAVVSAVAVRSNTLHVAYRDAKAKVNAAMTAEEVNAVELEV